MPQSKPAVQTYFILDPGTRYVGANRIKPGQKSVLCTEAEAKFFLEGGGLSLTNPEDAAKAKEEEGALAATGVKPADPPAAEESEADRAERIAGAGARETTKAAHGRRAS